jgi:hypothetical protein
MRKLLVLTAVLPLVCLGGIAHAATIGYTVGIWESQYPGPVTPPANAPWGSNGYPGDTLKLVTYTGTLDLTPGTYTQKINTLLWSIDYTYAGTASDPNAWSDLAFNVDTFRSISFDGGPTGYLTQGGLLEVTWENDFITINNGLTTSFIIQGYQVDITPLGFARTGGSDFSGSNPWDQPSHEILAQFDVKAAVPEPGTLLLLGLGLMGIAGMRRKIKS